MPALDDLEEMEESDRENWEEKLILISIARNPQQVREEIEDLNRLAKVAEEVSDCWGRSQTHQAARIAKGAGLLRAHRPAPPYLHRIQRHPRLPGGTPPLMGFS